MLTLQFATHDASGTPISVHDRLQLLQNDVEGIVVPVELPTMHTITDYIRATQIVRNNLGKTKHVIMVQHDLWEARVDRLQRAIGASSRVEGTDTKRKDLRALVTATWGPLDPWQHPHGRLGIKEELLDIELDSACLLRPLVAPYYTDDDAIIRVQYSYDDLYHIVASDLKWVSDMEDRLEMIHFDVNNLVKMIEMENRDARQLTK